jgi:hypothetical protein
LNIFDLLSSRALALGIMCDGCVHPSGLVLGIKSFNTSDVICLMSVLRIRFNIVTTIHCKPTYTSKGARISIPAGHLALLRSIV